MQAESGWAFQEAVRKGTARRRARLEMARKMVSGACIRFGELTDREVRPMIYYQLIGGRPVRTVICLLTSVLCIL